MKKQLRKVLVLLVAVLMLTALVPASFSAAADGEKLIDLDMSTFVEDTATNPDDVDTSIGSIVNSGTLASSTVVKMSANNPAGNWRQLVLKKESFRNIKGDDVSYIHRTIAVDICADKNRHNIVIENGLEEQANTISFWANYIPVNKAGTEYNILDYNVTYDEEPDSIHLFTLDQAPTTTGGFKLVGHAQTPVYGDIKADAAEKWALYTVTNPEYDETGSKTMKVYVNGRYLGSNTVTKPAGALEEAKLCFGGESFPKRDGYCWPTDFSLGDIAVYEGEMTGEDIEELYENTKDRYTVDDSYITDEEANAEISPKLVEFDLTNFGYSLEGDSGITNKGTSATAQFDIHSVEAENYNIEIKKQTLYDKNLEKVDDFILLTHDRGEQNEMGKQGMVHHFMVTDEAFENNSITVSFWVNIDKGARQQTASQYVELAQYEIKYTYDGETDVLDDQGKPTGEKEPAVLAGYLRNRLWQWHYEADGMPQWSDKFDPGYTIDSTHEWHHVVMTIPKFDADGKKTAKTYIDGAEKRSLELTIPTNLENLEVHTPAFRIGGDQNSNYVPDDMSIAGFKIYQGAFPKDAVKELYDIESPTYIADGGDNVAINKITFKSSKTDNGLLLKLNAAEDGDAIKINIKENIEPDFRIFVGAYDANGNLIDLVFKNSSDIVDSAINYLYKAGTDKIKVYTWFAGEQKPIQKVVSVERIG